jgi:flagellar basal body rod protein FlgB
VVDSVSTSLIGLNSAAQRLSTASSRIANASTPSPSAPTQTNNINNIRLDEEIINSKLADISYTANAKVIKVQLKAEKELLDILA